MPKQKQIDKFREAAREHGADTSDAEFDKRLREIARPEKGERPKRAKTNGSLTKRKDD